MKLRRVLVCLAPVVFLLAAMDSARGEDRGSPVLLRVMPSDVVAGYAQPKTFAYHAQGLVGRKDRVILDPGPSAAQPAVVPAVASPGFYPLDVSNPANGPSVVTAQSHPIYLNEDPSHWGDPETFLTDLGASDFIHLLDQYAGSTANGRYTLGSSFAVSDYPVHGDRVRLNDLFALTHAAAQAGGGGYEHIYHLFIPSGVDVCINRSTCYSPDNPATWVFCAFHASVTFQDVGLVLFTVQPFQNVVGCSQPPAGTPNGQLTDSTNDTLSHELFETISDPVDAWYVRDLTFGNGEEIADVCTRAALVNSLPYSDYGTVTLNGHDYSVQPEYSDAFHGCTYAATAPAAPVSSSSVEQSRR